MSHRNFSVEPHRRSPDAVALALGRLIARKFGHGGHWWRATEGQLGPEAAARLLGVSVERLEEMVRDEAAPAPQREAER